jgi:hypothetical protein
MQREFPLAQAAARSDMDERSFRLIADRRIIFATPRTRTHGRGKQKLYSTDEILIASILAPLLKLGADTFSLGELADQVRGHLGSRIIKRARDGVSVYVRLQFTGGNQWNVEFAEAKDRVIPVMAGDFIAIRLDDKVRRVEEEPDTD